MFDVKSLMALGQGTQACVRHQLSEEIFCAQVLSRKRGSDGLAHLIRVGDVSHREGRHLWQKLQGPLACHFEAEGDLGGLKAHLKEILSLVEQVTGKGDDQVSGITTLSLLHLRGHNEHLSSRVLHLQLLQDRGGIRGDKLLLQVVNDHLLHAIRAQGSAGHLRDIAAGGDILVDGLLQPGVMPISFLKKSAKSLLLTLTHLRY